MEETNRRGAPFMWMCSLSAMYSLYTTCAVTRVLRCLQKRDASVRCAELGCTPTAGKGNVRPGAVLQEAALKLLAVVADHFVGALPEDGHLQVNSARSSSGECLAHKSRNGQHTRARLTQVALAGGMALEPVLVAALLLAQLRV